MVLKRSVSFITGCCWRQTAGQKIRISNKPTRISVLRIRNFQTYIYAFEKKSIRNFVLVDIAVGIGIFFLPLFYNRIDILH